MAHLRIGAEWVNADVRTGTKREALLYSVGANSDHGLPRTNADKRHAVKLLLEDSEWADWSDREIARRCCVHHVFVGDMRRSLVIVTSEPSTKTYTTKHGTIATMNTENIGKFKTRSIESYVAVITAITDDAAKSVATLTRPDYWEQST